MSGGVTGKVGDYLPMSIVRQLRSNSPDRRRKHIPMAVNRRPMQAGTTEDPFGIHVEPALEQPRRPRPMAIRAGPMEAIRDRVALPAGGVAHPAIDGLRGSDPPGERVDARNWRTRSSFPRLAAAHSKRRGAPGSGCLYVGARVHRHAGGVSAILFSAQWSGVLRHSSLRRRSTAARSPSLAAWRIAAAPFMGNLDESVSMINRRGGRRKAGNSEEAGRRRLREGKVRESTAPENRAFPREKDANGTSYGTIGGASERIAVTNWPGPWRLPKLVPELGTC